MPAARRRASAGPCARDPPWRPARRSRPRRSAWEPPGAAGPARRSSRPAPAGSRPPSPAGFARRRRAAPRTAADRSRPSASCWREPGGASRGSSRACCGRGTLRAARTWRPRCPDRRRAAFSRRESGPSASPSGRLPARAPPGSGCVRAPDARARAAGRRRRPANDRPDGMREDRADRRIPRGRRPGAESQTRTGRRSRTTRSGRIRADRARRRAIPRAASPARASTSATTRSCRARARARPGRSRPARSGRAASVARRRAWAGRLLLASIDAASRRWMRVKQPCVAKWTRTYVTIKAGRGGEADFVKQLARPQRSVVHERMPRCARALLLLLTACAVVHEEPAVRGMPLDDRRASLSAVWVGHATVLLRIGRRNVIADPNLGGAIVVLPRETPASLQTWELPPIDVALLSHMHLDHFDAKTLRQLGRRPAVLYPKGGEAYDDEIFQTRKRALSPWESIEVAGLTITAVPVRHQGGRYGLDSLWNHAYTGYVIEGAGRRVFFAGDTGYDPHKFREVGARYMVPIHFESYYRVGGADRSAPRRELTEEVRRRRLDGRVFALRTGERIVVPEGEPFVVRDTSLDSVRVVAQP